MKRGISITLALVACALGATARASAADDARSEAATDPVPIERFRFHAGASLLAPAGVGSDGAVCVGTADGYVHLLGPDGSYRWSYSIHGAIVRRPVQAAALWFVATSTERIYALTAEGTIYWVFKPPSAVSSELAADAAGAVYFVGADHFLYGVSGHGGVSLRAPFGELKSGPSAAPDGAVWAENQAGISIRVRGQDVRRVASGSQLAFTTADALQDPEGHEWRTRATGVLAFQLAADSSPVMLTLTDAPLLGFAWSESSQCAIVSARDGLVVALAPPVEARSSR